MGGDDLLCDHAQHDREDEGDDAAAGFEFENMSDPGKLSDQNPATFEEFVQMHQQIWH